MLWIDLTYLINESLIHGTIRGVQRVMHKVAVHLKDEEKVGFTLYVNGQMHEVDHTLAQHLLTASLTDREGLCTALGYKLRPSKSLKAKARLHPSLQCKSPKYGLLWGLSLLLFTILKTLDFKRRRAFISPKAPLSNPVSLRPGDTMLEMGIPSENEKISYFETLPSKVRFALVVHDSFYLSHTYFFRASARYRTRMKRLVRAADKIICPSDYTKNALI